LDREKLIQRLMVTFQGELEEHARGLNRDLLSLESGQDGASASELLTTLLRTAHSLKGSARSVNVSLIESACHHMEDIFAAVQGGQLSLGLDLFQLLFSAADGLDDAARRLREKKSLSEGSLVEIIPRLQTAAKGQITPRPAFPPSVVLPSPDPKKKAAGSASCLALPVPSVGSSIPPVDSPVPTQAEATRPVTASRVAVPVSSEGSVRISASKLDALLVRSGELLVAMRRSGGRAREVSALRGFVKRWQEEWLTTEKELKRLLMRDDKSAKVSSERSPSGRDRNGAARALGTIGAVKESLGKIDKELAALSRDLSTDHHILDQTASSLDQEIRRARMLPFAEVCEGFTRTVRDLSRSLGKEVNLSIEGGDVEIDRSILERIKQPIMHLVRNAVDHGIETHDQRTANGKPAAGLVTVAASMRGDRVEILITDDGGGLDFAAIRREAKKRSLPEPTSDLEASHLLFASGFSTSRMITTVSGRGVGLDVVKTHVESLHGNVEVSSKQGQGTRFVLNVPLTVTTIQSLLVVAGGQTYAIPAMAVEKLLRVGRADVASIGGREVLLLDKAPEPLVCLAELLGLSSRRPIVSVGKIPAVLVSTGTHRIAFLVDELMTEQEVVVKSFPPRLALLRNFAGATILETGRIALILNVSELVGNAIQHAASRSLTAVLSNEPAAQKKRLIVADDSVTTRTLVEAILEEAGYEVNTAADGMEAWQILQEKGADLVVSDVEMPRMDGFSLTETIRGSSRYQDLPVILVTALETERDKARGMEVGADAYLVKSAFDQQHLLETIQQLV